MGDRLVDDCLIADRCRHPGACGGDVRLHPIGEPADIFQAVAGAVKAGEPLVINLLYGNFEGGQRVITQFSVRRAGERWLAQAVRHFNVDQPDPR